MRVILRIDCSGGKIKLGLTIWHVVYHFEGLPLQMSNVELWFLI